MTVDLQGHVFNGAGVAINGATVEIFTVATGADESTSNVSATATTTTDSTGLWTSNAMAEGAYDVRITSGTELRWLRHEDKISFQQLDVRNGAAAGTPAVIFSNTTNSATNQVAIFRGANTTRANNDEIYLSFELADAGGALDEFARITAVATDVTAGGEDGALVFYVADTDSSGDLQEAFRIASSTGGTISQTFTSDSITFGSGSDTDVVINFNANTYDGVLTWMEDEDYFKFSDDILMNSTERISFYDTAIYIYSSADGQLDLVADTEVQIAATTIDINGAVVLNGAITGATNITLSGVLDAATLDLSSSADIAGDLVLSGGADGALQFSNAGENSIKIPDNQASALIIEEADNAYITFVTTNSSEAITVAKATTFSAGIANAGTIAAGTWNGTAIATGYIAADAITGAKIVDDAIDSEHYTDGSIDFAHIQNVAANSVLGRNANSSGVLSEVALATTQILIGDGTGFTAAALSGDATMTNAGVVSLAAAQTGVTSLLATDIKIGEDTQTLIDFETVNEIHFDADNAERVKIDSTGLNIVSGSLETATIDYTDGDIAITIADGGGITAAAGITSTAAANAFGATSFSGTITGPSGTWDSGGVDIAASDSYAVAGTDILSDSSGTMTLSNVDALDATTESTIEAAIDTLANLTAASALVTVGALSAGSIASGFGSIVATTIDATTDFTIGATIITDGVITDAGGLQIAADVDMANNTLSNVGAAGNDFGASQLDLAAGYTVLGANALQVSTTAGNLSIDAASGSVIRLNDAQANVDVVWESDAADNVFHLDASTGTIGINRTAVDGMQMSLGGSLTGATGNETHGLKVGTSITVAVNQIGYLLNVEGGITEASSGTHTDVGMIRARGATISGAGASTTNASTLYLQSPMAGATNNYTIFADAGEVRIDGDIGDTTNRVNKLWTIDQDTTNAENVSSWSESKTDIQRYDKSALDIIGQMAVITARHLEVLDPSRRQVLSVAAETIQEPLVAQMGDYGHDLGIGPRVDMMGLAALNTKAIQELASQIKELKHA